MDSTAADVAGSVRVLNLWCTSFFLSGLVPAPIWTAVLIACSVWEALGA